MARSAWPLWHGAWRKRVSKLLLQASIHVYAASSLKGALDAVAVLYQKSHPGVQVRVASAGSQTLAAQIKAGAPADLFCSADFEHTKDIPGIQPPMLFARNSLALAVRPGLAIRTLKDLAKAKRIVLADSSVPVGAYSAKVIAKATKKFGSAWRSKVESAVVSRENSVAIVLRKVELGEADAGIVYVTDLRNSKARLVPIPADQNVTTSYWSVALTRNGADLQSYLSREGAAILASYGFKPAVDKSHAIRQ